MNDKTSGCCPPSADSTSGGVLGGAVRFRPIQRAGGGGGGGGGGRGGGVLSTFRRFNEPGCCPLSADSTSGGVDRVVHVHVGRSDGGLRV